MTSRLFRSVLTSARTSGVSLTPTTMTTTLTTTTTTTFAGRAWNQLCRRAMSSQATNSPRILVTGSMGQIGTELLNVLRQRYGVENVYGSDIQKPGPTFPKGPFVFADVTNYDALAKIVVENRIDWVIHLASLLSAVGEKNPQLAIKLNARGIENVLELARTYQLRVFAPSTIAVFGPSSPRVNTPDTCIMRPTTIYGTTKVYLELLGEYYHNKYGVDFRSVRYPGVISNVGMPGGGTTDYAVEIYHEAIKNNKYTCFLSQNTEMPMMYMPDCLEAVVQLMETAPDRLTQRVYNVTGMSFTPAEVYASIRKHRPSFTIDYKPDFRQAIADTWPKSLDDSQARKDWAWSPKYDLERMTVDMLNVLHQRYNR